MRKIDEKVADAVRKALPRMGEGYRSRYLGGNTTVSSGSVRSRPDKKPCVVVRLYDTDVVRAEGSEDDYELTIDCGYFSAKTRARVNAALEGLRLGMYVLSRGKSPAWFNRFNERIVELSGEERPVFRVVGGKAVQA